MSSLSVMILCGRSPRHLYVANRLCRAARPVAIVQETGSRWNREKFAKVIRPAVLWRKGSFGTHSERGSRFAERILTVRATLKKQKGRALLGFLTQASQAALSSDVKLPSLLPDLA